MSDGEAHITVSETGPYRVEPGTEVYDAQGNRLETRPGKAFFLCRCGHSSNKPFCDGSHNQAEWSPALGRGA